MKNLYLFFLFCLLFSTTHLQAQCTADAGEDQLICGFDCVQLQAAPAETYHWSPAHRVSDSIAQSPIVCTDVTETFYLTITDSLGCTATDSITIFNFDSPTADAGPTFVMTEGDSIIILDGSNSTPGAQYAWTASEGGHIVFGADTPHPGVDSVGVYTLTVSIGDCSESDITFVTADESITLFCAPDQTVTCNQIPTPEEPEVVNHCESDYFLQVEESIEAGDCPYNYTIIRYWTASNGCNQSAECTQVITVVDDVAPGFGEFETQVQSACHETDVPVEPSPFDNCSTPTQIDLIFTDSILSDHPCDSYTIRTWTAIDACGNATSQDQHIFSSDVTAPIFTFFPDDINKECHEDVPFTPAQAMDDCSQVTISHFDHLVSNDTCYYIVEREWIAMDECGNMSSTQQIITVEDTEAPVFAYVPPDMQSDCGGDGTIEDFAEAFDNCDNQVDIDFTETIVADSACHFMIEREWIAIDNCGNTASAIQMISVIDSLAPILHHVPTDTTIACEDMEFYLADTLHVFATDNCTTNLELIYNEVLEEGGNSCSQTLTRTWEAVDDCGNIVIATQTVNIIDFAAPILSPVDGVIEVSCGETPPLPVVTVEDNCDENVEIIFNEYIEFEDSTHCYTILIREWTAIDDCQNVATVFQEVIIRDDIAPQLFNLPNDMTIECHELSNLSDNVEATDNCSEVTIDVTETIVAGDCPNEYTLFKNWMAIDACGNSSEYQQVITVEDNTAPILEGVPGNMTLDCGANIPVPPMVEAVDNCETDLVELLFEETITGTNCPYSIVRTWTAHDPCGNTTTQTQIISIGEPTIECPDIFSDAELFISMTQVPQDVCIPAAISNVATTTILVNGTNTSYTTDCDTTQASIQLFLDEGEHEIIAIDDNGCQDTIYILAELACPPLLEPFVIQTETFCEEDLRICLEFSSINDLDECIIILNNEDYDGYLGVCEGTNDRLEVELPVGEHELVFIDALTGCVKLTYEIFISSNNFACDEMDIHLNKGWNIISSYIMPQNPDISAVFEDISVDVISVKNDMGAVHIPTFNINDIGDWNIEKGYKVKTQHATTLTIRGTQVQPETTGVTILPHWQIISYLRDTPKDVMAEIGAIAGDIIIVKGATGGVAIPVFGINNLGDLEPGQGYKVRAINHTTLFYSPNTPFTTETVDERSEELTYFTDDIINTGNNATMVMLAESVEGVLHEGDEVGIFTPEDLLAGAAVYTGSHFAITIWGDDNTTSEQKEGFDTDENYIIKHWNHQTNTVSDLEITYSEGNNLYQEDAVAITATVQPSISIEQVTTPLANHIAMESTPNPARDVMTIHLQIPTDTDCAIQLVDMNGRVLAAPFAGLLSKGHHQLELSLATIPAGVYLYQLQTSEGVLAKRIVVTK